MVSRELQELLIQSGNSEAPKTKLATGKAALANFTHVPVRHFIRRVSETLLDLRPDRMQVLLDDINEIFTLFKEDIL